MKLATCAAGIMICNLMWSVVQERVGATEYCADGVCERFKSIPVMNLLQASASALVALVAMISWDIVSWTDITGTKTAKPLPARFADFFESSLCHTIASPVGYMAMRYIPYPLYILVSSCKLIPVMIVGMIVNRTWRSNRDYACAAIMTVGIIMYSWQQISGSGAASTAKAGHHGAAGGGAGSHSLFGIELDATKSLIAGVGFTLLNLSMEGYTNASQDRLFSKGRKEGRPRIPALFMMASMNAWTVVILSVALAFEVFVRGAESFLWSAGSFAHRHPELVLHICSFSVLGAIAQIFIFTSIEHHGSFTTTTVTISRKFVSVLISVAVFGHALSVIQWIGVLNVFAGLGIQLSSGSSGHAHAHAQPKSPGASIKAEATAAHVPAASIGKASAAAAAADRAGVRRRRRAVGPIDVSSSQGGYGYDSLRVESTPSSPMAVRLKEGHSSESEDEDGGVEGNEGGAGGGAVDIESPSEKRGARMSAGAGAGGVGFAISGSPSEQRSSGGGGAGVTRSGSKSKQR